MRDLNTLLNSLVNVDRKSLIAILMSEAQKAEHHVRVSRHRTGAQREKRRAVIELLARIRQILSRTCPVPNRVLALQDAAKELWAVKDEFARER